ncbi:MAG: hypothetical protein ABI743_06565 [bacterium]
MALAIGCAPAPAPSFDPVADGRELQRLCPTPPYPVSFSAIKLQATGHLKEVLQDVDYVSATGYLAAMDAMDQTSLRHKGAVIVLEHRLTHIPYGVMLVLFDPDSGADTFQIAMMRKDSPGFNESQQPRDSYPFNWYQPDTEPDAVADLLFVVDPIAKQKMVDEVGEPLYEFRWGEP